ncbi:nuclease-related domain-containing protein [Peribacillus sp. NPDC046944]|uniref:nuclease-related domain-containing protein n=1 Tax=unclassified Peribacillus TaxID=2675266 RepID=UPI003D034A9E
MIVKDCEIPIKLQMIQALIKRLPITHPIHPVLSSDFNRNMAGYKGEHRVIHALKSLPEKEYLIFHDLRLLASPYPFQMDILLLTPCFILILEVKNIAGELYFDKGFNQLIRTKSDGQREAFDDPILQVNRQRSLLIEWLKTKSWSIPIETLVVSSNSSSVVTAENKDITTKVVIRRDFLFHKIREFIKKHDEEKLTKKELKKVTNHLLKAHTPLIPNLLENYKIPITDLKTGVFCPRCSSYPMKRKNGIWICHSCSNKSKDAHLSSLQDYFFLIKPTITNQQLREFLHIHSASTANKLLKAMDLPHTGVTKGRVYHLKLKT